MDWPVKPTFTVKYMYSLANESRQFLPTTTVGKISFQIDDNNNDLRLDVVHAEEQITNHHKIQPSVYSKLRLGEYRCRLGFAATIDPFE